jgi:hypothetical protein
MTTDPGAVPKNAEPVENSVVCNISLDSIVLIVIYAALAVV